MKHSNLFLILLACITASPPTLQAQPQVSKTTDSGPLLTLDEAASAALTNNRLIKNSSLEAQKFDFRVNTMTSRRLPQFQFATLAGEFLHSFDFTFPPGVFGKFPGIGPIPATSTAIQTPARFMTFTTAGFDEPITQQYKISLGVRATKLGQDVAREDVRA